MSQRLLLKCWFQSQSCWEIHWAALCLGDFRWTNAARTAVGLASGVWRESNQHLWNVACHPMSIFRVISAILFDVPVPTSPRILHKHGRGIVTCLGANPTLIGELSEIMFGKWMKDAKSLEAVRVASTSSHPNFSNPLVLCGLITCVMFSGWTAIVSNSVDGLTVQVIQRFWQYWLSHTNSCAYQSEWLALIDWLIDWFIHSFIHSLIDWFIDSLIHWYIHSLIHSFIHWFIHSFIHSCIHSCIHAFMHSCIHAFMHGLIDCFYPS